MILPPYNLPPGTIVEIDGRPFKPLGETIPGRLHLMDCHTGSPFQIPDGNGGVQLPTPADYDQLILDDRLKIKLPTSANASRKLAATAIWSAEDCEELDKDAPKKLFVCLLLDNHGVQNGSRAIKAALSELWTEEVQERFGDVPNHHTIKRWRTERGQAGDRTMRDMVGMSGKCPRAPYLSDDLEEIKQKHALIFHAGSGKKTSNYANAVAEVEDINNGFHLTYPKPETPHHIFSYDTFRRACVALVGDETGEAKHGKGMVNAVMKGAGKPLTAQRALEKVIIDHTPLDGWFVVDPERLIIAGRPWLTAAIDVYSRATLAYLITFWPPSVWTVCEIIRRMALPKRPPPADAERHPILSRLCGKPYTIYVDNALEFTSQAMEDACKGAGIAVHFCAVRSPRMRAIGERFFATVPAKIMEFLPGRSMPIEYCRTTGYNAEEHAVVTMSELDAVANKEMAAYNLSKHEGIQERQPALMFQKSANRNGIDVLADPQAFMLEICAVEPRVQITNSGVRMFNMRYFCPRGVPILLNNLLRFEPRRQPRVNATVHAKVKYSPEDISVIHVWDRTTRGYVTLRCNDETYAAGMPLWFHQQILADAKAEGEAFESEAERLAARSRTIDAIRNIAPEAKHRERITVGKLYDIPRLRQLTGNIIDLDYQPSRPVTIDEFIPHDLFATTALDDEILSSRPEPRTSSAKKTLRDRRDASPPRDQQSPAPTISSRRRNVSRSAGQGD